MSPVNQAQLVRLPLNHGFVKLAKQGSLIPAVNYALIKVLYLFTKNKIPSVNFHYKISYIFFYLGGIFKETEVGAWVHLVCALYVPGVAFSEVRNQFIHEFRVFIMKSYLITKKNTILFPLVIALRFANSFFV